MQSAGATRNKRAHTKSHRHEKQNQNVMWVRGQ